MAANKTAESQADHETCDDGGGGAFGQAKFIKRDAGEEDRKEQHHTDLEQDCGRRVSYQEQQQANNNIEHDDEDENDDEAEDELEHNEGQHTNGQAKIMNAMDQSTDTTTNTTNTTTSTPSSPTQATQNKQDESFTGEDATSRQTEAAHVGSIHQVEPNLLDDNTEHDGDDEGEDLEEGELKDDDDDDDDDDDEDNVGLNVAATANSRFSNLNNNNDSNNTGSNKDPSSSYGEQQRLQNDMNSHNNRNSYNGPQRPYHNRRHFSPNQPQHPGMHHPQHFPMNQPPQQFPGNNDPNYRFPHNHEVGPPPPMMMMPQMHPAGPGPGEMYPRGMPVNMGPVQKVNVRCRFYSRTGNKCTWGDLCRFEHRDDSPGPNEVLDDRLDPDMMPGFGPPGRGPPQPLMGPADRPYPPYSLGRHQLYPGPMPPQPYGYGPPPYEHPPYGPHHHSNSPPLPVHSVPPHHWRQQHSPYPSPSSSAHMPEPDPPALLTNPTGAPNSNPSARAHVSQPLSGSNVPPAPPSGGALSPGYSSPSSSAVYERKHRLAYEAAPWNDRGYPPSLKYERGEAASGYLPPTRGGYYRNPYGSRDPYERGPPPPHMSSAPYPYPSGYPANYPSSYRGGPPMGHHASHFRYSSSSQRTMPPDSRRSRSNKRTHDGGESSWSDSGSEDSILGQASYSKSHANKMNKKHHQTSSSYPATEENPADAPAMKKEPLEQSGDGGGTPSGEPLPEDRERQEMLLNKLKEIEDLMAKKKEEQDDSL